MTTRVRPVDIRTEMSEAFYEYSLSVITSRAIPDVYDGLKPVQRRILYAASEKNLRSTAQHRKSATLVGEVIGKYHPHGDSAIYDALVRMAQSHTMRYPLIDPQGNFGTIDDPPAAMRYTECRLARAGELLVDGIDESTVGMVPTFDGTTEEPERLPAAFPNLLANGTQGIAVGMSTSIPPYNLGEIIDLALWALDHPTVSPTKWPKDIVPAPDFPTGGVIICNEACRSAVLTGKGKITIRSSVAVETVDSRPALVYTELPYQVSADSVMETVGNWIAAKTETEIVDIRNQTSARTGLRVVFVLQPEADPDAVIRRLWRSTRLQSVYPVNAFSLSDGVPALLGVAHMLKQYLDGRLKVVELRTRHRLRSAELQLEKIEGLRIAAANLDEVIALIRASPTLPDAERALAARFDLTKVQTQAVVALRLGRLTGLSIAALDTEANELQVLVGILGDILADKTRLRAVVGRELIEARELLDDGRRSALADEAGRRLHVPTVTAQVDASGTVRVGSQNAELGQGLWTIVGPEDQRFCAALRTAEIASVRPRTGSLPAPVVWAGPRPQGVLVLFKNGRLRRVPLDGAGPWKVTPPKNNPPVVSAIVDYNDPFSALFVVSANGYLLKFPKGGLMKGGRLQAAIRLGSDDRTVAICDTATGGYVVLLTDAGKLFAVAERQVATSGRGNRGRRTRFGRLAGAVCAPSDGLLRVSNANPGASAINVPVSSILESTNVGVAVTGATRLALVELE